MKYGYDKKLLKSLGVGPFLGQVKLREKMIAEASDASAIIFSRSFTCPRKGPTPRGFSSFLS